MSKAGMSRKIAMCLCLAALPLAACKQEKPAEDQAVVLHPLMKGTVAPQAQILWDTSAKAMNDKGDPDGSAVTAADWETMAKAAAALSEAADKLVAAKTVLVVEPGQKIQDEDIKGSSNAKQVQGFIDGDRAAFKAMSEALAQNARGFIEAIKTRDAAKLNQVSGDLDAVCEACHKQFWYPQQASLPQ